MAWPGLEKTRPTGGESHRVRQTTEEMGKGVKRGGKGEKERERERK